MRHYDFLKILAIFLKIIASLFLVKKLIILSLDCSNTDSLLSPKLPSLSVFSG